MRLSGRGRQLLLITVFVAGILLPTAVFGAQTPSIEEQTAFAGQENTEESTPDMAYDYDAESDLNTLSMAESEDTRVWSQDYTAYYEAENPDVWYSAAGKLLQGVKTIDGVTYGFNDGKKIIKAFGTFSKKTYYFDKSGVMVTGLKTIDKKKYYFGEDGVMVTGLRTIDKKKYFFDKNGVMQTGVVKIDQKLYYFDGKGAATTKKNAWFIGSDKKKRYGLGGGRIAAGVTKVGSSYCFFNEKTGLPQPKGFFKNKGKQYYSKGNGLLVTGWMALGKKAFYFYQPGDKEAKAAVNVIGSQAKNTVIGHLKIPKRGYLGEAYALGIKTLNKKGWTLKAAYKFSYKLKYYDRWYRQKTSEKYALRGFKRGKGNCYVMASTFYIMAKLLGYNIHQVYGKVGLPHSWTEIKQNGRVYVYDPNFRNETGRNGWKIWYGKKGTWRYHKHGQLNKFVPAK